MKRVIIGLALVMVLSGMSGCMGRMGLSREVKDFNLDVVEHRWAREGVFLGLHIIPVYPFCSFIDLLIINSIEFWSGTNPMTDESPVVDLPKPGGS